MSGDEKYRGKTEEGMGLMKAAVLLFMLLSILLVLAFGADRLLRTDSFPVRNVRFEGEFKHVTQKELENAVVKAVRGNFFLLNLDAVKSRVESLPWVYQASVRRQWPQDVHIRFTEQQLSARWGDGAFLNQAGDVVRVAPDEPATGLPRLQGPEGTGPQVLEYFKRLGQILAVAGLKLERMTLTPRRVWRLDLADGMAIVLDQDQPEYKLERFARVYAQSLRRQAEGIGLVDLRYANGFAVQQTGARSAGHRSTPGNTDTIGTGRTGAANKG
ncbi:MAG: FtsQ-type POTRA domain-containing protein [Gammaproteobacteria bacterium]|nr:FtsQ-type POTRA domain-containing protein [Gammaproteobacteria bacterium]